jgi:hypothetical protein
LAAISARDRLEFLGWFGTTSVDGAEAPGSDKRNRPGGFDASGQMREPLAQTTDSPTAEARPRTDHDWTLQHSV